MYLSTVNHNTLDFLKLVYGLLHTWKDVKQMKAQSITLFHRVFFNSIIDKHQHMHFFTFKTVLV